jgi:hypothetical protein
VYRKNKNNWVKHLDFMILDLICLQVAFFLAYTLRHRTVNLYTNYIYANLSIVLILIDVCLLIFLNTLKNVLKPLTDPFKLLSVSKYTYLMDM